MSTDDIKYSKVLNLFKYIIMVMFGGIVGVLFLLSVSVTAVEYEINSIRYDNDNIIKYIVIILFIIIVGSIIKCFYCNLKNADKILKYMLVCFMICSIGAITYFVLRVDIAPISDQQLLIDGATDLMNGDNSMWLTKGYFGMYPNNNGIAMLTYYVMRICGNNTVVLMQLINVLFYVITIISFYKIIALLYHNSIIIKMMCIALLMFMPLLLFSTQIYGNIIGLALSLLSLLFLLRYFKTQRIYNMIFCGIFISMASYIKMNFLIFAISIFILLFFQLIQTRNFTKLIIAGIIVIMCFPIVNGIFNCNVKRITGLEISKGMPIETWVALGLRWEDENAPGRYDAWSFYVYQANDGNREITKALAVDQIKYRLDLYKTKYIRHKFFKTKVMSSWSDPTYGSFMISMIWNDNKWNTFEQTFGKNRIYTLTEYMNIMQSVTLFGVLLWLFFDRNKIRLNQLFFGILFIGGFIFHLFWEIKAQYVMCYMFVIIPYAVLGYNSSFDFVISLSNKLRKAK